MLFFPILHWKFSLLLSMHWINVIALFDHFIYFIFFVMLKVHYITFYFQTLPFFFFFFFPFFKQCSLFTFPNIFSPTGMMWHWLTYLTYNLWVKLLEVTRTRTFWHISWTVSPEANSTFCAKTTWISSFALTSPGSDPGLQFSHPQHIWQKPHTCSKTNFKMKQG